MKETNRIILKEIRKTGYKNYKEFIKDMQRKEILLIRKKRKREKWAKYQKDLVLKGDLYME